MTALMLSVSCSKEFDVCSTVTGQPVTISASIPELDTKSVPSAPEGHVLRCVLVVDHPTVADARYEAVADGTNNFSFTFTPQESGYRCLLWADYIDASASAVDGRYADKYYDTDDLRAVGYVETVLTDGSLFNNEACDAFSGVLAEGKTQVTLLRPFARLTFKNKDANTPVDAVALSISYNVYTKYDVAGRTVATSDNTETISASGIAPADAAAGVWFFNYVFAPDDRQYLDTGNITLTKDSDEPKTIATAGIPLDANHDQGLTITYGESVDIDVDIEDNYGVTVPKVGDFFYSDGTWSTDLDQDKTVVGVIFATADGDASSDAVANYDGSGLERVRGWVVSAYNVGTGVRFYDSDTPAAEFPAGLADQTTEDVFGYANTSAWTTDANARYYTAAGNAKNYDVEVTGTSGWYLPSVKQMTILVSNYAEVNEGDQGDGLAVKNSLALLENANLGEQMSSGYYWTSTGVSDRLAVYRCGFHATGNYGVIGPNTNISSGSFVRAVLTF